MSPSTNLKLFNLFSFFTQLDFYVPIKVVYFHQVTGSYATASLIIAVVPIAQALLEVPTGIFSDFIGRKKTMIGGAFCSVLAYFCYAFNPGLAILLLGSMFEGASRAFFSGNNNAYLHNLLSQTKQQDQYHHHYGKLNSVMGVAMFMAALASGFLAQWALNWFMWLNLIPQLIALALAVFLADIPTHDQDGITIIKHLKTAVTEMKQNFNLRYLSLAEILGGGGMAASEYQAAVYAAVWPTWAIGIARAIQEIGVTPSFYYAGKVIDKLGQVKVLALSTITSTLGNILAALSHSFLSPLFIMISLPLYGAADTAKQHLLQQNFTERQRATIASLNSLGNSITFGIVLYLSGLIANRYGPFVALVMTQVFLLPSNYFEWRLLRNLKRLKTVN